MKYLYKHEYKDYLVVWDEQRLLYRIAMQSQAGKVPVKMKNLFFNKPQEAFSQIDTYLRERPVVKKRKSSATKEA